MLKGFKEFISRGNAVDLAVGVVIGAAFTAVINSIVTGILNPLIGLAFSANDLAALSIGPFAWGAVVAALINFLLVAVALYFFVVTPLNALAKRRKASAAKGEKESDPTELEVLQNILALLEKQQTK